MSGKPSSLGKREDVVQVGALLVNQSRQEISINVAKLPAPSQVYDADLAWFEYGQGQLRICFGKLKRAENRFRTRVEVRFPVEDFKRRFWTNSIEFHQSLNEYCSRWSVEVKRPEASPQTFEADREHSEWANVEYMAHSGSEAVLDFYHLSPAGLARYSKGLGHAALDLQEVLRVQLSAFELKHLLDEAATLIKQVEKDLPSEISESPEGEDQ